MTSVDIRTKVHESDRFRELSAFRYEELPELLDRYGACAGEDLRRAGLRPLALEVDGDGFTLRAAAQPGGPLVVVDGVDDDAIAVELDADEFSDLVQELRTATTLLTAGSTRVRNGTILDVVAWDPVLRSALDGRPAHRPGAITFRDCEGGSLDLHRTFGPDDEDAEIGAFLAEAGFVHLSGWHDPADMARISADIDAAGPSYEAGDGKSWWATVADGARRLVRLQEFSEHSPTTRDLLDSDRHVRIAALTGDGHSRPRNRRREIEALIKPIRVVQGISDVPWHKDCSLGGHPYDCNAMTVGISVTDGDAESGLLQVVAGSHRANIATLSVDGLDLPVIDLPTRTGDVTIHLSCTMHRANPPVTRERRVLYTSLHLPSRGRDPHFDGTAAWAVRERAHETASQPPAVRR
jgi:hypothetical protein